MLSSRPPEKNEAMTFPGLYVGQVKIVENDDEQYPGRIKVSIPSIYGSEDEAELFVWARPCFPYGHFFVPEEGDRVWLAFENGNPRSPVWLGIWYPEDTTPEDARVSPPKKRVIHTSSGHSILFNDTDREESVEIKDKSNNQISLSGDGIKIQIESGATIEITDSGISIDAGSTFIEAKGSRINLEATDVNLEANNVKLGRTGSQPVARVGDQGIGNLGAPVIISPPGNLNVRA